MTTRSPNLAEARELHATLRTAVDTMGAGGAATAALLAALDFHAPVAGDHGPACKTCVDPAWRARGEPAAYPCAETAAIAAALGAATAEPPAPPPAAADLVGRLMETGDGELVKVSEVFDGSHGGRWVTAQLMVPPPPRTLVRHYGPVAVARWREPSDELMARYHAIWGVNRPAEHPS